MLFKEENIASFIHWLVKSKQLFTKNLRLDTLNNDHMLV